MDSVCWSEVITQLVNNNTATMFTVLLSSQSHCLSSRGSFNECKWEPYSWQPPNLRWSAHVIPTLKDRHWLPVEQSCLSYVCWCIKFMQVERHPIFTTASPHQPTSLHVLVCAPPAVDVTNGSARVWSLENARFCVLDHHCINSLTLRLSNDN